MSSGSENWISKKENKTADKFLEKPHLSPILAQLLLNRHIMGEKEIDSFLNPSWEDLHDPNMLPDIAASVSRIKKSIKNGENVLVFGDYDADGIISTALMHNFLKKIGLSVDCYIPSRFDEGYDINLDFFRKLSQEGRYQLLICVDCGTNALEVKEFTLAPGNSLDVIVCDHHEPVKTSQEGKNKERQSNKKFLIINPKVNGCGYPFKFLSGAGVTFKFITAILKGLEDSQKKGIPKNYLNSIIDLVAVSTIADVMPLLDENRTIVKAGLKILKNTCNTGLKKLMVEILGEKADISVYDVGFLISPRLNAAGRVKKAEQSLKLLLELPGDQSLEKDKKIRDIVLELNDSNRKRQEIQLETLNQIVKQNDLKEISLNDRIFIGRSDKWNEGILGIVAADIVKKFNIPAILFQESGGKLKGSGRSTENFNLYLILERFKEHFLKFGGHSQACGITMLPGNFQKFKESLIEHILATTSTEDFQKKYYYDMELDFGQIDFQLLNDLQLLEPYGNGNPKPVFLSRGCELVNDPANIKNERHLILKFKNNNVVLDAIIFNYRTRGFDLQKLKKKEGVNILYSLEKVMAWGQNPSRIQLLIHNFC